MLLLDTHLLIWIASDSPDLTAGCRRLLHHTEDTRYSPLSLAEITIKATSSSAHLSSHLGDFETQLVANGIRELPYRSAAARAIERFPLLNRTDPFDRMLLAQAAAERADFLTADHRLLGLGLDWILDARA